MKIQFEFSDACFWVLPFLLGAELIAVGFAYSMLVLLVPFFQPLG